MFTFQKSDSECIRWYQFLYLASRTHIARQSERAFCATCRAESLSSLVKRTDYKTATDTMVSGQTSLFRFHTTPCVKDIAPYIYSLHSLAVITARSITPCALLATSRLSERNSSFALSTRVNHGCQHRRGVRHRPKEHHFLCWTLLRPRGSAFPRQTD